MIGCNILMITVTVLVIVFVAFVVCLIAINREGKDD